MCAFVLACRSGLAAKTGNEPLRKRRQGLGTPAARSVFNPENP